MKDKERSDKINERHRLRIREERREELAESIDEEVDESQREDMEQRLEQHKEEPTYALPPIGLMPKLQHKDHLSWKYRYGLRLFKIWAWCRSKFGKGE